MYTFIDESMLPKHLSPKQGIPDKVRPLRKFAMGLGIKRPYLYNKAELTRIVKEKISNE